MLSVPEHYQFKSARTAEAAFGSFALVIDGDFPFYYPDFLTAGATNGS